MGSGLVVEGERERDSERERETSSREVILKEVLVVESELRPNQLPQLAGDCQCSHVTVTVRAASSHSEPTHCPLPLAWPQRSVHTVQCGLLVAQPAPKTRPSIGY